MLKLRPHHMICFNFYKGNGYSAEFIAHMNELYTRLQKEEILLVKGCDEVCSACPHRTTENLCDSIQKVKQLDEKVLQAFDLKIGAKRHYLKWQQMMKYTLNKELHEQICGICEWYQLGVCKIE